MDKNYIIAERNFEPITLSDGAITFAIIAGVIALIIITHSYKRNDESWIVVAILFLLVIGFLIIPWLHYKMGISKGEEKFNPIPLSKIEQYVHVDKSKIVIDELPEEYFYNSQNDTTKPEHVGRRIFEFKYDSLFEKVTLVDENGNSFRLNDDDIKFLEKRGANNG